MSSIIPNQYNVSASQGITSRATVIITRHTLSSPINTAAKANNNNGWHHQYRSSRSQQLPSSHIIIVINII